MRNLGSYFGIWYRELYDSYLGLRGIFGSEFFGRIGTFGNIRKLAIGGDFEGPRRSNWKKMEGYSLRPFKIDPFSKSALHYSCTSVHYYLQ